MNIEEWADSKYTFPIPSNIKVDVKHLIGKVERYEQALLALDNIIGLENSFKNASEIIRKALEK